MGPQHCALSNPWCPRYEVAFRSFTLRMRCSANSDCLLYPWPIQNSTEMTPVKTNKFAIQEHRIGDEAGQSCSKTKRASLCLALLETLCLSINGKYNESLGLQNKSAADETTCEFKANVALPCLRPSSKPLSKQQTFVSTTTVALRCFGFVCVIVNIAAIRCCSQDRSSVLHNITSRRCTVSYHANQCLPPWLGLLWKLWRSSCSLF